MSEFKRYHPVVNLIYFLFAIAFSCIFMHPVCLGISLVCSFAYSAMLKGSKSAFTGLGYILPLMIITALINPAFNHRGITILTYLPGGNPLTLESIIYGVAAAAMLASVILWFSCFNEIMTSDKFVYLFGKILPSLSLVLSMVLRFVPKFRAGFTEVNQGQKCIGKDIHTGSAVQRCKNTVKVLSVMVSRSLEESIDTADSMKSRGYGLGGRTAFSNFKFTSRDRLMVGFTLISAVYIICGWFFGGMTFYYYPEISEPDCSVYGISLWAVYALYCTLPIISEIKEARKWK